MIDVNTLEVERCRCKFYYQGIRQMLSDEWNHMCGFIFPLNVNFI